jgi:hypothetical protein
MMAYAYEGVLIGLVAATIVLVLSEVAHKIVEGARVLVRNGIALLRGDDAMSWQLCAR